MNHQKICAAIEKPFNTAFKALTPPVKIYFDNVVAMPPDAPGEYVMVNITFGMTSEDGLECLLDRARGAIIVRIFAPKNAGGLRARQLATTARTVLLNMAKTKKTVSGVFLRTRDISGPTFFSDNEQPHFMARIEASWQASDLG
jgi:hypothetical protein